MPHNIYSGKTYSTSPPPNTNPTSMIIRTAIMTLDLELKLTLERGADVNNPSADLLHYSLTGPSALDFIEHFGKQNWACIFDVRRLTCREIIAYVKNNRVLAVQPT